MPAPALKPRRRDLDVAAQPGPTVEKVQAFAVGGLTTPAIDPWADRRGPLRPGKLIPTRARVEGEALANGFRAADTIAIIGLTWVGFDLAHPAGLWTSPAGAIAPYAAAAVLLVMSLAGVGAYAFAAREGLAAHLMRLAGAFGLTGALMAAALFGMHAEPALRNGLALWLCIAFATIYLMHVWWWASVRRMRRSGRLAPNVVVVGATKNAERLIERALESREIAVLGVFDDRKGRAPGAIRGVPVLGDTADLIGHRIMPYVDRIVITVSAVAQSRVRELVETLSGLPNEITLLVDMGEADASSTTLSRLCDLPLARMSNHRADARRARVKRVQDLVISLIALVLAAPIMAAVALAVRLDSPGPILFRQRRQGFNNEEIVVLKFRSMHHARRDDRAERQISVGDDRVTRVGRFIRKTSLDELPQIFNVLKGEMSLVGPRPHSPTMKTGDVESIRLVAEYAHRHRTKPGITGWAAIKGSRGPVETPEKVRQRVALDIDYIERQSFWLDLYIMAATLPCLLGDRQGPR